MAFYYQVAGFLLILHSCISKCQGFSGYVAQRKQREVQREGCESKKQMAVSGSFRVVSLNLAHGEMVVMTLYVILPWLIDPNQPCRLQVPVASYNRQVLHSSYISAAESKCLVLFT